MRRQPHQNRHKYANNRGNIHRQLEADEPLKVLINIAAPFHSLNDGGKGVIQQHNIAGFLGHLRAGYSHGNTYVCLLECRGIIDTIACHGYYIAVLLPCIDYPYLILR